MATHNFTGHKIAIREIAENHASTLEMNVAVLRTGTPIKELVQGIGKVHAITMVAIMLRNFCSQFNVSKNMTQSQIEDYAADLVLDYMDFKDTPLPWKFEEYAIFFDRAAKNHFRNKRGESFIFDRIDRNVIEEMFEVYCQERTQARWKIEDEIENQKRAGQLPDLARTGHREFDTDEKGVTHLKKPTIWDLKTQTEKRSDGDPLAALRGKYGEA